MSSIIIKKDASYSFLLLRILTTLTASIRVTTTTELWSRRWILLPGWVTKRDVATDWLAGSAAAATASKRAACSAQWFGVCNHRWTHPSSETMFIGSLVAGCSVPTAVRTSTPDRLGRSVWRLWVDSITVADPRSWTCCLERSVLRCSAVAFHM